MAFLEPGAKYNTDPITRPMGRETTQNIDDKENNPRYDFNQGVPEAPLPSPTDRIKWSPPTSDIELSDQASIKSWGIPRGNTRIDSNDDYQVVNVDYEFGPATKEGARQTSVISEQVANGNFPSTDQPGTPYRTYIQTKGKNEVIIPRPFGNYSGQNVLVNVYIKGGKENAFTENEDGSITPVGLKYHKPYEYANYHGARVDSMKERGFIE